MKIIYKAATKDGIVKEGEIEARDVNQAVFFIRSKELVPIVVKEKKDAFAAFPFLSGTIGSKDVVIITRQLASMLSSGLTLIQSLTILRDQMQNPAIREMLTRIISDIQEGKSFSYAISNYPKVFSPIYISLVKSGESSGILDKLFERLADNLEKSQKLKSTLISALIYPAIIGSLMVIVVIIMMIFVVPQLESLYKNFGSNLPLPTQIVIGMSHFTTAYWPILIALLILLFIIYRRIIATDLGKFLRDKMFISLPIIGRLVRLSILAEFARTFGLLTNSGTLIVESLTKTADTAGNRIYKEAIIDVSHRVEKGITVGDAMATYDIFPPVLIQMVRIGEQTGRLDESLLKVSEYFEREVENAVKGLTTALEPAIMIVLGIGVTFLLISVITPIYNISSQIH